jgi:nucleoside-diphosphate-sugar epimerase
MKTLVVGGAGAAGVGLVKRLIERKEEVSILDITAQPYSEFNCLDIPYYWMAIQDVRLRHIKDYENIIYLAAQADVPMGFNSPMWTCYQNVSGAINFFEAARFSDKLDRLILASSGTEFGAHEYLPIDEKHPLIPSNPYSWSKASQEMAGMMYYRCFGVPVTIMSNGIVAGPGMRKEIFIYKWLVNLLQGKSVVLEGGDQTRDLTYITDVLDAWELVLNSPSDKIRGEKFQVSYGEEKSVEELLIMCLKECRCDENLVIRQPYRPGEKGMRELFNIDKAKTVLGYNPKISPRESIQLTSAWIKNEILHCT